MHSAAHGCWLWCLLLKGRKNLPSAAFYMTLPCAELSELPTEQVTVNSGNCLLSPVPLLFLSGMQEQSCCSHWWKCLWVPAAELLLTLQWKCLHVPLQLCRPGCWAGGVAAAAAALLSVLAFLSAVQAQCSIYTVRQGCVCPVLENNLCEILVSQGSSSETWAVTLLQACHSHSCCLEKITTFPKY